MNCPRCTHPVVPGIASVSGTLVGFLAIGLSYDLWLKAAREKRRIKIIESTGSEVAFRCEECGTFCITPTGET